MSGKPKHDTNTYSQLHHDRIGSEFRKILESIGIGTICPHFHQVDPDRIERVCICEDLKILARMAIPSRTRVLVVANWLNGLNDVVVSHISLILESRDVTSDPEHPTCNLYYCNTPGEVKCMSFTRDQLTDPWPHYG